jgi:hypothetical protein
MFCERSIVGIRTDVIRAFSTAKVVKASDVDGPISDFKSQNKNVSSCNF